MAKAPAAATDSGPPKKGAGLVVQIGVLVGLSAVVGAAGWFAGGMIAVVPPQAGKAAAVAAKAGHEAAKPAAQDEAKAGEHGGGGASEAEAGAEGGPVVVPLEPINTTLAAPDHVWVRMELALEMTGPPEPGLADTVQQDLLAYIRTVKLHQVQGPSGFLHLRDDLDERARIRTDGKAQRVLIRTLLFE